MIKAIVYLSAAGHSKKYAELLSERIGLPAHELNEAGCLPKGCEVIYIGWLMAGKVKGYQKAEKRFAVRALCAVGMGSSDAQLNDVRKRNKLAPDTSLFYLQGGFEPEKLHGVYRFMMNTIRKTAGKMIEKKVRTPEEDEMLELLQKGGDRVKEENLSAVIDWYEDSLS